MFFSGFFIDVLCPFFFWGIYLLLINSYARGYCTLRLIHYSTIHVNFITRLNLGGFDLLDFYIIKSILSLWTLDFMTLRNSYKTEFMERLRFLFLLESYSSLAYGGAGG